MSQVRKVLSNEDLERYKELVREASNTPVITFQSGEKDLATLAWERVQYFMQDMANKYDYDYTGHVINMKNGEIVTIEEAKQIEKERNNE